MKAVRFDNYGDIDVLRVADIAMPEPVHGEVLVKVKAASINPGEAGIRKGVPRQNLIRAECGAILSSRYSVKSLNLIKNCFEEREVLSGAGTSVRACSAYI